MKRRYVIKAVSLCITGMLIPGYACYSKPLEIQFPISNKQIHAFSEIQFPICRSPRIGSQPGVEAKSCCGDDAFAQRRINRHRVVSR